EAFAARELSLELGVDVRRQDLVAREALDHLPLELGQLAALALEDPLDVAHAVAREVVVADEAVLLPVRVLVPDLLRDARPRERRAVAPRRRPAGLAAPRAVRNALAHAPSSRAPTGPTAAASVKTTARPRATRPAGIAGSAARSRRSASRFSAPPT